MSGTSVQANVSPRAGNKATITTPSPAHSTGQTWPLSTPHTLPPKTLPGSFIYANQPVNVQISS